MNINYSTSFERMLNHLFKQNECRISNILLNCDHFVTTEFCDYITTRGEMLSYLPNGKDHKVNDDGKWCRDGRQEAKPAKLVRKIIKEYVITDFMITDKEFESFANNVKCYVLTNGDGDNDKGDIINLVIANGEFISEYYDKGSHAPMAECNLTNSCMRSMEYDTFDIYVKNPDVVSLVVAINNVHQVLGRALLWKTDESGYCMDTIYASDTIRAVMIDFARKMGFKYKSQQSCHWSNFDMYNGINVGRNITTVSLKRTDFSYYPYLDTLSNLSLDEGKLRNIEWDGEYRSLRSTGGDYESMNECMYDDWTGCDIAERDGRHVDYRLPNGERFSGYTHLDNLCEVEHHGYVLTDHAIFSTELREWIVDDADYWIYSERDSRYYYACDVVDTHDNDFINYDDAVKLIDGSYAHYDDAVQLADGSWELLDKCIEVDGVWVVNNDNQ